jgi:hypothetical protein
MAVTIVEDTRAITGGVDTHAGTHVAAALDHIGREDVGAILRCRAGVSRCCA